MRPNLHKGIVDRDNIDATGILFELVRATEVAGDVSLGAAGREGGGNSEDQALARLGGVGDVDLVARVLAEELNTRDGVADFDLQAEC